MHIIRSLFLKRSSISWANGNQDVLGRQSSSNMMPYSSSEKNQSKAPLTARRHPRFSSRNKVLTSQSQSTAVAIARASSHCCASPGRPERGPSAATYKRLGCACRIASNTTLVVSGRLNTRKRTGQSNLGRSIYDRMAEPLVQARRRENWPEIRGSCIDQGAMRMITGWPSSSSLVALSLSAVLHRRVRRFPGRA